MLEAFVDRASNHENDKATCPRKSVMKHLDLISLVDIENISIKWQSNIDVIEQRGLTYSTKEMFETLKSQQIMILILLIHMLIS